MMESTKTKDIGYQLPNGLTNRKIFDYFAAEIFGKTDKETHDFMLKTAFLPKMTVQTAEKVTGIVPYRAEGLAAAVVSSSQIKLSWTYTTSNERNFQIQRRTGSCSSGGAWATIATVGANTTSYSDAGLTARVQYAYRVRATTRSSAPYAYGYSMWSVCRSAITP